MERKEREWRKLYSHPVYKVKPPEINCDVVIIGGGGKDAVHRSRPGADGVLG